MDVSRAVQENWHAGREPAGNMPVVLHCSFTVSDRGAGLLALLAKTLPSFDASSPAGCFSAVSVPFQRRFTVSDRCAGLLALLAKTPPSFDASSPADCSVLSQLFQRCAGLLAYW